MDFNMKKYCAALLLSALCAAFLTGGCATQKNSSQTAGRLPRLDGLFYETTNHVRTLLPAQLLTEAQGKGQAEARMPDGRVVKLIIEPVGDDFNLSLTAEPAAGISRWGLAVDATAEEYFTGLMERVVDGPQAKSWAPGITAAMNLRGEKVDMILKPTMSVYAPFYISSDGYAVFVRGNWPGVFDFCVGDPKRVKIEFEGLSFACKIYTAKNPAELVTAHALDAGPPFLPPKWMYLPWRWRDENTQRTNYYDGTPVAGPFNSEFMEDELLMKAYGIPCGVYWIDRPWGPGFWGYDDFLIDERPIAQLRGFGEMARCAKYQDRPVDRAILSRRDAHELAQAWLHARRSGASRRRK